MKDRADLLAAAKGMLNRDPAPLHAVPELPEGETTQPMEIVPAAPAALAGRQMGFLDQARHQATYTRQQVREARHREGGVVHRLWHGQPRSMAQHAEYVAERRWVKPGHKGGVADKGGVAFHAVIGKPGVAVGNAIAKTCSSPLAFTYTYFGVLAAAEVSLIIAGDSMIAIWIGVVHVAIIVAAVLTLSALTRQRGDDEAEDEEAEPAAITGPEEAGG